MWWDGCPRIIPRRDQHYSALCSLTIRARRRLRAMTFESIPFAREYRQGATAQGQTRGIAIPALSPPRSAFDADIRRRHHWWRAQWADLRRLPRHGGPESQGPRTTSDDGRRGGHGRVLPRVPKLGGGLPREPVEPQDHRRSSPLRPRTED